jgi:hypothetical protein
MCGFAEQFGRRSNFVPETFRDRSAFVPVSFHSGTFIIKRLQGVPVSFRFRSAIGSCALFERGILPGGGTGEFQITNLKFEITAKQRFRFQRTDAYAVLAHSLLCREAEI